MSLSRPDFLALCEQHGLGQHADALHRQLRPRIRYHRTDAPDVPPGGSRVGGGPDVPSDFEWPMHDGRALDFLLQLNLADLQGFACAPALPAHGTLAFFYDVEEQPWGFDPADRTAHRVYWFEDVSLQRRDALDAETAIPPSRLTFRQAWSLPHPYSQEGEVLLKQLADKGGEVDEDDYLALVDAVAGVDIDDGPGGQHHAIGGYSYNLQGDMQLEAQLVSHGIHCGDLSAYEDPRRAALDAGTQDWMLLIQVDSDDDLMWGDSGVLYCWIRDEDLKASDFSRTWLGLQCY